jgi:hypothetical protein
MVLTNDWRQTAQRTAKDVAGCHKELDAKAGGIGFSVWCYEANRLLLQTLDLPVRIEKRLGTHLVKIGTAHIPD